MKRLIALFTALCLLTFLTGCSYLPRADEPVAQLGLPDPGPEEVNMILGERIAARPENITLYYVSGDGSSFSAVTRSLAAASGESIYAAAMEALLLGASMPNRISFLPSQLRLLDVEFSRGIATVNLSLDAYGVADESELLMLAATISNTLLSLEDVRAVNILIDGRAIGIAGLPIGLQTDAFVGITPAYAQMSAERDYFLESSTGTISRSAVLYFPASEDEWFVPEARIITLGSDDYASALIRALREGPAETACTMSVIPEGVDLLVDNPTIETTSSGMRVLNLDFAATMRNFLAFSGIEQWQMIGSIALTLCSFIPDVDAVRVSIGGEMLEDCTVGEEKLVFEDGLILRSTFDGMIGSTATLYLPNENNTLDAVERAVSMERAQSPQSLLQALFDEVLAWNGVVGCFPEGVYYNDLLGISVENEVASVNLSANFYRQSQALDAAAERGVIYAMVNTLCGLDDIRGVRFYIEGISAETLSGSIYLRSVLLPNPGLISDEKQAVPELKALS